MGTLPIIQWYILGRARNMTHVPDFSVPRIVEAHASVRLLIAYRAA